MKYDYLMEFSYNWGMQPYFPDEVETGDINYLKQKTKLLDALQVKNSFRHKHDLGVFGEILGYVNFAAVATLAAIHLNKYYINPQKTEPNTKKK